MISLPKTSFEWHNVISSKSMEKTQKNTNDTKNMKKKKPQDGMARLSDVFREYWTSMRSVRWIYLVIVLSFVISTFLMSVMTPLYLKDFFDVLAKTGTEAAELQASVPLLMHILFIIFGLGLSGALLRRLGAYFDNYAYIRVSTDLRERAFAYFIGHSYGFFSSNFTGGLVQRIARFTRSFNNVTDRLFYNIIPMIVRIVGIIVVLTFTYKLLAWVLGAWILFLFITSYGIARWKLKYSLLTSEADSRVSAATSDALGNHTTIQLFGARGHENNRFHKVVSDYARLWRKRWNIDIFSDTIYALFSVVIHFTVFYITIKYWGQGGVTVGIFVLAQTYILSLNEDIWNSSRIIRDMYEAFADSKEAVDVMKLPHEIQDAPNAKAITVSGGTVELKNVAFAFDQGNPVIRGVSLAIASGERVAFIGPSGAGKSTLVRLILRFYDIQSGSISIDGQDISKVTQDSLRNSISFVPQDPILFHRTLMENIRYGRLDATDEEVIQAAKLAHCHEFISSFPQGYDTYVGERGVKLSGGERQRVAIARAILKNAPILILDEATSSLDSHSEVLIQEALDVLMKNKTVIVIAHRLSTIKKMDRIIVVNHGTIIEEGTHEKLIADNAGMYAKLWSLQSGGFIQGEIE
ncbi:MAG: hypothetical protein RIT04_525 [Candidatus Parcubacteria bacterium]|jgi:ATP-binding cassette subfamily B protein